MRTILGGLVLSILLLADAAPARAGCGDVSGDAAAVRAVVADVLAACNCCGPEARARRIVPCTVRVVRASAQAGTLRRACVRTALRRAHRACRRNCAPRCTVATQCDDDNACTTDACVGGRCAHECRCFAPAGHVSCCPGPGAECSPPPSALRWVRTCGDPVCRVEPAAIPGLPACTTQEHGHPCVTPGAECDAGLGCNARLRCADREPTLCPISQRKAKREITYLTSDDTRRLHEELMHMPLATYRYRSEGPDARRRLGFIIDDVGASPAVAPDRSMVDLYAFTSMAVAALQEQGREIDRLRHEMRALRRTCGEGPTP